jgi:AAA+ superfamily predicted ATPase
MNQIVPDGIGEVSVSQAVPVPMASLDDVAPLPAGPYGPEFLALQRLDAILARALAAARERYGDAAKADSFRGLYVSVEQAAGALDGSAGRPLLAGVAEPVRPDWDRICDGHPGWAWVRDTYGLTGRDLDVLLIALAPEVDLRYERLYGYLQDDVNRRRPTVDLVLDLVTMTAADKLSCRSAFRPDAPLVDRRIVALVPEQRPIWPPLLAHVVKLDEQIVDVLLRQGGLDRRLAPYCRLTTPPRVAWTDTPLPPAQQDALLGAVEAAWGERPLRLYFHGPRGSGRRATTEALAGELQLPLLALDLSRLPAPDGGPDGLDDVLARAFREACLHGGLLYLDGLDALRSEQGEAASQALAGHLSRHDGVAILAGSRPWTPLGEPPLGVLSVSFQRHGLAARRRTWERLLVAGGMAAAADDLDDLAARFRLGPGQIRDAVATAAAAARWRVAAGGSEGQGQPRPAPPEPTRAELFAAARNQSGHDLGQLARRIEPVYTWDDLILPADSLTQLHQLCQRVALRERVLGDWGFERKLSQGRGITALFTGPPGTGKTMAAEVIAGALGVDLFTIDLSSVISKYIGETEKNLERVFSAAANTDAILLFDEADALFGKRSEVRDSHDRYANIETAYLLQRMEQHDGLAMLATNLRQHLDDAFTRRLQFVVEFPFPDDVERRRIWRVCFPAEAPLEPGLDLDRLAREFRLSGANIRNVAMHAAFLAAAEDSRIGMGHLLHAIRREHQKMGKVLSGPELDISER